MSGRLKGDLTAYWNKTSSQGDVMFNSTGDAVGGRRLLYHAFSVVKMSNEPNAKSLLDELEARGYDLTTIRFSINHKPDVKPCAGNKEEHETS